MRKFGIVLGVVLLLYVAAAIAACLLLPQQIADAEARSFGVRVAIAKMTIDLHKVEERVRAVKDSAKEKGYSKITEVAMILGDADLNQFAHVYLGGDWVEREDALLEKVVRSRGRLFLQKKRDDDSRRAKDEKIRELELRKKMLSHVMHSPHRDQERETRRSEIDRQLAEFCEAGRKSPSVSRKDGADPHEAARAKNEAELLDLAASEEESSVGILRKDIADKLEWLRWKAGERERLQRISSVFFIWPFNEIFNVSAGSGHEERL